MLTLWWDHAHRRASDRVDSKGGAQEMVVLLREIMKEAMSLCGVDSDSEHRTANVLAHGESSCFKVCLQSTVCQVSLFVVVGGK